MLGQTSGNIGIATVGKIGDRGDSRYVPYVSTSVPFREVHWNEKLRRQKVDEWPRSTTKVTLDDVTYTQSLSLHVPYTMTMELGTKQVMVASLELMFTWDCVGCSSILNVMLVLP